MKNKKNKKRLVLKGKVQTILEFIAATAFSLFVMSVDSDWTIEYFKFVGVLVLVFAICVLIIRKFGDLTRYE